ncbi:MAG: S26 family signal peptidase [Cytophagales bacterium]
MIETKRKGEPAPALDILGSEEQNQEGRTVKLILQLIFELLVLSSAISFFCSLFVRGVIVTSRSMEPEVYEGDVMLSNVACVGGKAPQTLLAISNLLPFMPNKVGGYHTFWTGLTLPPLRLKGYGKLKSGQIAVFREPSPQDGNWKKFRETPPDLRDKVVKRIYLSGDTIEIKNGQVYLNGKLDPNNKKRQYSFVVEMAERKFQQLLGKVLPPRYQKKVSKTPQGVPLYEVVLNNEQIEQLRKNGENVYNSSHWKIGLFRTHSPEHIAAQKEKGIDPYNIKPFRIPSTGDTIQLDENVHPLLVKTIQNENPDFRVVKEGKNVRYFIKHKQIQSYQFKAPTGYAFPMGNNVGSSYDGRSYGAISQDGIEGLPFLILFSFQDKHAFRNLFSLRFRPERFLKRIE